MASIVTYVPNIISWSPIEWQKLEAQDLSDL